MKNERISLWNLKKFFLLPFSFFIVFTATAQNIPDKLLLEDSIINTGHIGISIYEPATNQYWYNYNATKYFVPSSNTKLFTLYAGMKYLGDSLKGIGYSFDIEAGDTILNIYPTGDPSFLHPDFKQQPVLNFLKKYQYIAFSPGRLVAPWGKGWVWDDYTESFMVSRSVFPVYGNIIRAQWIDRDNIRVIPSYFASTTKVEDDMKDGFQLIKDINSNSLYFVNGDEKNKEIPFTSDIPTVIQLLSDTLKNQHMGKGEATDASVRQYIYSQPSDSLFKIMMQRSDNFFAEQTLLMVSNEKLGHMNDEDIIDTLLKTDLKDIPQQPKWVDGCGLSRYDLFTPQDLVYIINKMKKEFGLKRLEVILPTGNEGTLKGYYVGEKGAIYAKTGSMSNHFSLSGILVTKGGKTLVFSVLVNDFIGNGTPVKKAIERFLEGVREKN